MLHLERELFEQIVLLTAQQTSIESSIIEKDYYVTMFLKELSKTRKDIIFKGGTSLSKCYKIINRFSEDIDLNIISDAHPTEGQRRQLKRDIFNIANILQINVSNEAEIKSRRDYNRYIMDYISIFNSSFLKEKLLVETSVFMRAYPTKLMQANSYVYEYLLNNEHTDIIEKYELQPFEINVQTAERTFIDKVFALCDYYLSNIITEHSRHIYDLYRLSEVVSLNDELKSLAESVRKDRKIHPVCLSAQDNIDINTVLLRILNEQAYKNDYESITASLLFDNTSYTEATSVISNIIESKIF